VIERPDYPVASVRPAPIQGLDRGRAFLRTEVNGPPTDDALPEADARLLAQIRAGDADAGHRFVREYYPSIYRHLLYLAGQREVAEDLTQETFFQAWRHLDRFEGRAPLRHWLHRIAHREFLRSLRSKRAQLSLEEAGDLPAPRGEAWTEAVELRELIRTLPRPQREAAVLHYLEGYACEEIAEIVGAPAGTIKYRLSAARARLQRELGEGDLTYLNEPVTPLRQWAWLPLEQMQALEARLAMGGRHSGVQAFGRSGVRGLGVQDPTDRSDPSDPSDPNARTPGCPLGGLIAEENTMERREFLRTAAAGAAGLMLPAEKEVIDDRLTRKVSLAVKGMALSDLCELLRTSAWVHLVAGNSVADEKVTVFCEKLPLREVMRQLSRPFGYTWLRSGTPGQYRYELGQDLRSQLLEEELRNRDRSAAFLALESEIRRYQPYLDLSPDEALARARTAPAADKPLLEHLATDGWGPIQLYFRLSPQQLAALRAGQTLTFSEGPKPGDQPLPADLVRGILQCQRTRHIVRNNGAFGETPDPADPRALPLTEGDERGRPRSSAPGNAPPGGL
jgi:RNA polymerase sigma-70 factor (ECF subfamily)